MGLAQGHNALTPVKLEPAAPLSRVKHTALPTKILMTNGSLMKVESIADGAFCYTVDLH